MEWYSIFSMTKGVWSYPQFCLLFSYIDELLERLQNSGVGTNFVLGGGGGGGGARCIGRAGPKQHYIIMSNKINKVRIHT